MEDGPCLNSPPLPLLSCRALLLLSKTDIDMRGLKAGTPCLKLLRQIKPGQRQTEKPRSQPHQLCCNSFKRPVDHCQMVAERCRRGNTAQQASIPEAIVWMDYVEFEMGTQHTAAQGHSEKGLLCPAVALIFYLWLTWEQGCTATAVKDDLSEGFSGVRYLTGARRTHPGFLATGVPILAD